MIGCTGLCNQGDSGAVVVGSAAHEGVVVSRSFHRAAFGRVGRGGDSETVSREVGDIVTIGIDHKGVGGIGGDFHAVLGPVDEIVQGGGSGGEGDGFAVQVGACAADCATVGRVGGGGDVVVVWCEFDKKFSIFCDCECDGWFG